jgi:dTDP-4-dehydrorhamnose reductase
MTSTTGTTVAGPPLVVGAGGQVGNALRVVLGSRSVGTWRQPPPGELAFDLDAAARTPELADRLVAAVRPSVVFVAAGMTHVDGCEDAPELAGAVNRDGPAALARATRAAGGRTVYFSTDYVFDGIDGPFTEDDPVRPLSVYGRSKAEGERAVLEADDAALVVRTTVVYGAEPHGRNFAYQVVNRLRRGEPVQAAGDQITTPTYNPDLAAATTALVDAGVSGVVHVAGPEVMDRAGFARRLAAAAGLDPGPIQSLSTVALGQRAARPLVAGLRIDRLRALLPSLPPRVVEDAVAHWAGTDPAPPWRVGSGG